MDTITSCNTATLSPYVPTNENPWDYQKARHVYDRLGFGAPQSLIQTSLSDSAQDLINSLITEASTMPNTGAPEWGYWSFDDYENYADQNNEFNSALYRSAAKDIRDKNLKGRLTFFWLNHFVVQRETVNHAPYMFQYWDLLQTYCLGNFKNFVKEVGTSPAMLLFLNGFENTKNEPNENYARELFELFTLGQNNGYTQDDIEETSRALTGFNHWDVYGGEIRYDESTFDATDKIIFGQEGPWGYQDVINILFEQKGSLIAKYICTKLYTYFVSPSVNEAIINELSQVFIDNSWELIPVLDILFKSEHFFDSNAIGMVVKSPFDLTMTFYNQLQFSYEGTEDEFLEFVNYIGDMLGQNLFEPIDVAGWQRDQDWINTSTLSGRWLGMEYMTWRFWNENEDQFKDFAINLTGGSTDPEVITRTLVDHFLSRGLYTASDYDIAVSIFRWEIPENYWDDGIWNWGFSSSSYQVILLMHHIFRMPEFQLK